jgi:hypothetical protein
VGEEVQRVTGGSRDRLQLGVGEGAVVLVVVAALVL